MLGMSYCSFLTAGFSQMRSETCIKGHRSSSCKHTDRPLFEIKKKGRPVTQCEHCRELRKTRQIHVKCVCESKEGGQEASVPGPSGQGVSIHQVYVSFLSDRKGPPVRLSFRIVQGLGPRRVSRWLAS